MQGWKGWGEPGLSLRLLGGPSGAPAAGAYGDDANGGAPGGLASKRAREEYEPGEMVPSPRQAPPRMEPQVRPLAVDPRRPTPPPASDSELPSVRVVVREDGSRAAFQPAAPNRGVVDPSSLIDNLVQSGLAEQLISAVSQRQQQQQQQQQQQIERPQEAVYSASYEPVDPRSLPPPGMYSQARAPPREPDLAGPMRHAPPRFSAAVPAEAPSSRGELYGPGPGEELYGHPAPQPVRTRGGVQC